MHEGQRQLVTGIAHPQRGQGEAQAAAQAQQQGREVQRAGGAGALHQPDGGRADHDAQPADRAEQGAEEDRAQYRRQQRFALGQADARGIAAALEQQHHQRGGEDLREGGGGYRDDEAAAELRQLGGGGGVQQCQIEHGQWQGPDEARQGHAQRIHFAAELFLLGIAQCLAEGGEEGEGDPEHR
ncbi:hypothetical protein D3C78_1203380 [compost metagenome]